MFPNFSDKKPIIIGHRGAAAHAPENTISSIKKALELHVPMIEFDVHQCASGELVVIHDFSVDRTTNGTGLVADMTYSQLRELTIEGNEHIPTLPEVLDTINKKAIAVIELKGQNLAKAVADVINEYIKNKDWSYNNFLIVSFDHAQLQEIKKLLPQVPIGPTCYGLPANPIKYMQALDANVLSLHPDFVTQKLIDEAHKNDIAIFIWYDPKTDLWAAKEAIKLGVDGIFEDAPNGL